MTKYQDLHRAPQQQQEQKVTWTDRNWLIEMLALAATDCSKKWQ
jgi:hypothetical protein